MSAVSVELAAARAVRVRAVGLAFVVVLAVSVGLSSIVIGSILSTALLIGPPAAAFKVTCRLSSAIGVAIALGVGATLAGIVLAYDSYDWSASHRALPVSFFVVAAVVVEFALASALARRAARRARAGE